MGKNKMGRPSWFKLFLHHKSLIDAVPDEVAGRALKAALRYFDTGEVVELDSLAGAVFAALKPHIDEAFEDFRRSVDTGRAGQTAVIARQRSGDVGWDHHPGDPGRRRDGGSGLAKDPGAGGYTQGIV